MLKKSKAVRSAGMVMVLLALAKVIGLLRQQVIANYFGTTAYFDAYTAALSAPEILSTLLAYSTLGMAFIPIFTGFLSRGRIRRAHRLASSILTNVFLVIIILTGITAIFAPLVVKADWGIAPGFEPHLQDVTANLLRIALLAALIFTISGILSSILHSHKHFLTPALAPIAYDIGVIIGAVFISRFFSGPGKIFGLAWGVVLGAMMHAGVQLIAIFFYRFQFKPQLGWKDPAFWKVIKLMIPRVIDLLMARLMIYWLNSNLGSKLSEGSVSALGYAYQLMNMPETIIGTAIGFVVLPTLSQYAARRDDESHKRFLNGALRAIIALSLPAAVGILLLGKPIIQLLFQRGEFSRESTNLVFFALQFYTLGIIAHSMLEIVVRTFASRKDTLTPLVVSFFTTALNIVLAVVLIGPLAHGGLALANSIAVSVEVLIGLIILHIVLKGIYAKKILVDGLKSVFAAVTMGGAIWLFIEILSPGLILRVLGGFLLGMVVYFASAYILGIKEVRNLPSRLINLLKKRFRK